MDPSGQVLDRAHEQERPRANVVGGDVVGEVDDPDVGRDPEHHRLAHADELVGMAKVGSEGDDHCVARLRADECGSSERVGRRRLR